MESGGEEAGPTGDRDCLVAGRHVDVLGDLDEATAPPKIHPRPDLLQETRPCGAPAALVGIIEIFFSCRMAVREQKSKNARHPKAALKKETGFRDALRRGAQEGM